MKRLFAFLVCAVLLGTTLVPDVFGQRRRSRFGRKARTAAIIAGGAGVGALVGGKKGAAIGAGGAGLYAFNRRAARRNFRGRTRTAGSLLSGAALGAGVGGAVGGKRAAVAGAALGAGGGYVVRRKYRNRRRY
jgi:Glycine zipper